jgi:hypothetical protein
MECAMTTTDLLNQKVKNLPESLVKELLDFAEFLVAYYKMLLNFLISLLFK